AYDVLRAYGTARLTDTAQASVPNEWYDSLPGESYRISEHPVIPLRPGVTAHIPHAPHGVRQLLLAISPEADVAPPPWRTGEARGFYEIVAQLELMNEHALRLLGVVVTLVLRPFERLIQ